MMSSLGFFFGLLLRFVRWFTRRAGTSISSLISSYWCVASVYCIGSPDERVRLFLLWFSFWFVDLLYCFGSPDERVRSFNLLLSSFCCCLFSLDHPTSGYDHLILYLLPLVYGFSFLFVLPSSGDYRSPFVCWFASFVAPNGSWQAIVRLLLFVFVSRGCPQRKLAGEDFVFCGCFFSFHDERVQAPRLLLFVFISRGCPQRKLAGDGFVFCLLHQFNMH